MRWGHLARHEGALLVRARSGKLLLGLVVAVVLLAAYVYPVLDSDPTTARFAGFVDGWLATVLPLVGTLLGYNAVVGERESGALKLSLSLPHDRRDLVLGTFAGRTAVLAGTIAVAMAGAAFLVVYPFGDLVVGRFLAFVLVTVAFGAIWTGLGVAVSLSVATRQRALVLAFGLFFLFVVAWDTVAASLELGLNAAGLIDGALPGPVRFVLGLAPTTAFERLTTGFIEPSASVDGPWYVSEWVALVVFGLWAVCPLGLAYRRFAGSDLS